MISLDTNILLPLVDLDHPRHASALGFAESLQNREDVAISEFVLLELGDPIDVHAMPLQF